MRGTYTQRGTILREVIHRCRRYTYEVPVSGLRIDTVAKAARNLRFSINFKNQHGGDIAASMVARDRDLLAKLRGAR